MKLLHIVNTSIFTFNGEFKEEKKKLVSRANPDLQFSSLTLEGVQHPDFRNVSPITDTYLKTRVFLLEIKNQKLIVLARHFSCDEMSRKYRFSIIFFLKIYQAIPIYILTNFHKI